MSVGYYGRSHLVLDEMTHHLTGKVYADTDYIGYELIQKLWQRGWIC